MTVIYNMSIDRADKPWIGDRRLTEMYASVWVDKRQTLTWYENYFNNFPPTNLSVLDVS